MLAYIAGDGLTRMYRGLQRLARPNTWMEPLLEQGVTIVWEDNRENLLLGRDIDGKAFDKVKRKHGGPPMLERQYRAINLALVDAGQIDRNTFELRISWNDFRTPGGRLILPMHMKPYRQKNGYVRPARRVIGIRQTAVDKFARAGRVYLGREFRELTNRPNVATGDDQSVGRLIGRR